MRKIKIFVASSYTLQAFREQLTLSIASKNKLWNDKGINLELVIWEDLSAQLQLTRSQDAYNRELKKCDFFVLLASNRLGKYTKEEFDVAHSLFSNYGKPKVFVYLEKDITNEEESLTNFKNELQAKDHFPAYYSNYDNLWTQLNIEIATFLHQIYKNTDTRTQNNSLAKQLGNIPIKPAVFMGREGKLSSIYQAFFEESKPVVMLTGEGGLGKTTIASNYYHHYKDYYSHLIWSLAESGMENTLMSLAVILKLQFDNKSTKEQQIEQVMHTINVLPEPVLMVIDNVDDFDDLMSNHQYLRKTPNVHILITSRLSNFEDFDKFDIKKLSPEIAKAFFIHYYTKYKETEALILEEILKAIGYNTLVIELLAKNLQQTKIVGYNIQKLLDDLQKQGVLGIKRTRNIAHNYHNLKPAKPQEIIEAMYQFAHLTEEELSILTLFSVLPEVSLPLEDVVAFSHFKKETLIDLLLDLANKAWLNIDDEQDGFKVNTIVSSVIRQKQQNEIYTTCKPMINIIFDSLDDDTNTGTIKNYDKALQYVNYASVFVDYIKDRTQLISLLFDRIGNFYKTYGGLLKALHYYERYNIIKKDFLIGHPNNVSFKNGLAISYEKLGETHTSLGNLTKALQFFEEDLKLTKKLYESHPNTVSFKNGLAISNNFLGNTYTSLGNLDKALLYFEEYSKLSKELYDRHPNNVNFKNGLAISYEKLGETHTSLGNLTKALQFFEEDLKLTKELYESHPNTVSFKNGLAISNNFLGNTYTSLGNLDKALLYFEEYSKLSKELYDRHPNNVNFKNDLAISYSKLGETYRFLGNLAKALQFFEDDLKLTKELYESHPNNVSFKNGLAISYSKLGATHTSLGNLDKALLYFEEYSKLSKELYDRHPNNVNFKNDLTISYSKLGETHTSLGNLAKALQFFEECSKLEKELYESHPNNVTFKNDLAISYSKLGEAHTSLGNLAKALQFFEECSKLEKELYESHPNNVTFKNGLSGSLFKIATVYFNKKNYKEALLYFNKGLIISEELYTDFPKRVEYKSFMGVYYQYIGLIHKELNNLELALEFFNNYHKIKEELFNEFSNQLSAISGLAYSYERLGEIYRVLNNYPLSLSYFQKEITLFKELYVTYPKQIEYKSNFAGVNYEISKTFLAMNQCKDALQYSNVSFTLFKELTQEFPRNKEFQENYKEVSEFIQEVTKKCK